MLKYCSRANVVGPLDSHIASQKFLSTLPPHLNPKINSNQYIIDWSPLWSVRWIHRIELWYCLRIFLRISCCNDICFFLFLTHITKQKSTKFVAARCYMSIASTLFESQGSCSVMRWSGVMSNVNTYTVTHTTFIFVSHYN